MGVESKHDKTLFKIFTYTYLKRDGVFIIRMVAKNTSTLLTLDLVKQLWKTFQEDLEKRDRRPNGHPATLPRQPSAPEAEESFDDIDDLDGFDDGVDLPPEDDSPPEKPPID